VQKGRGVKDKEQAPRPFRRREDAAALGPSQRMGDFGQEDIRG